MDYYNTIGLISNTVGSLLLAIALNSVNKAFNNSLAALEAYKDSVLRGHSIVSFEGLDLHRKRANKKATRLTNIGIALLLLGFVLQLIGLVNAQH